MELKGRERGKGREASERANNECGDMGLVKTSTEAEEEKDRLQSGRGNKEEAKCRVSQEGNQGGWGTRRKREGQGGKQGG